MAQLAIASSLPTQLLIEKVRAAVAGGYRRRHFVNLIAKGGWDSSWHHNTFSGRHLIDHPNGAFSLSAGGFEYSTSSSILYRYTSKCLGEDETELGTHPSGSRLGPAMDSALQGSDWSKTLIWKGLTHPGLHEGNNKLIIHGNSSSYAIGASSLISAALAHSSQLRLLKSIAALCITC